MGKFLKYLEEGERIPIMEFNADFIDLENPKTVVAINSMLAQNTNEDFLTPYIGLGRIMMILAQYGLHLPKMFLDSEHGTEYVELLQHGKDVPDSIKKYLYMEYQMNQTGKFDVFCQIVDENELADILDAEDDEEDEFEVAIDDADDLDNSYKGLAEARLGGERYKGKENPNVKHTEDQDKKNLTGSLIKRLKHKAKKQLNLKK